MRGKNFSERLAAVDQLIIEREMNLTRLKDLVNSFCEVGVRRAHLDTAITFAEEALHRLTRQHAQMVERQL
jgi:hypothetical protein